MPISEGLKKIMLDLGMPIPGDEGGYQSPVVQAQKPQALYDKMLTDMTLPERQQYFLGPEKYQQQEEQRKRIEAMPDFGEAFTQGVGRDVAALPKVVAGGAAESAIGLARIPTYIGSKMGFKPAESADVALQKAQASVDKYVQESGANPYLQAVGRGVGGAAVSALPMIGAVKWISSIPKIAGLSLPIQRAIAMGTFNAMQALPNVEAKDESGKNVGLQNLLTQTALGAVAGGISGKMDLNWQNVFNNKGAGAAIKEYLRSSIKEAIGDTLASGVETGIRKGTFDIDEIISDPQFIAGALTPLMTSAIMKRKELGSLKVTADAEKSLMRGFGYEAPEATPKEAGVAEGKTLPPEDVDAELNSMIQSLEQDQSVQEGLRGKKPIVSKKASVSEEVHSVGKDFPQLKIYNPIAVESTVVDGQVAPRTKKYFDDHLKGNIYETYMPDGSISMEVMGDTPLPKEQRKVAETVVTTKPQPEPPPQRERPKSFYDQVRAERERVGGYESPTKLTEAMARETTATRMGEKLSATERFKAATEDSKMRKVADSVIKSYGDDRSAAEAIAADIEARKDMSGDDKRALNAATLRVLENPNVSKDARLKKVLGDFSTRFGEEASKDLRSRIADRDGVGKVDALIEDVKSKSDVVQTGKKVKAKEIQEAATGKKSKFNDLIEVLRKLEYSETDISKILKEEGLPDDLLNKIPQNKVREKSLSSIVKEHYVTDYNSTKPLSDRLMDAWGISKNAADRMSTFIEAKYGQAAVDGAQRYVDALAKRIKSPVRSERIRQEINDALRRGIFGDEHATDALAEALGIRTFDAEARNKYKNLIDEADSITDDLQVKAKLEQEAKLLLEEYTPKEHVNALKDWYYASMFTVPTFVKTIVSPIEISAMKSLTGPAARLMDAALSRISGKPRTMVRESFGKNIKNIVPTVKEIASSYADIVKGYSQVNNDVVSKFISQYPETFDRINELLGVDKAAEKMLQTSSRAEDIPTGNKLSDIERVIRRLKESGDPKKNIAATILMLSRVNRGFVEAGDNAIFFQGFKDSLENQIEAFMKSQGLKFQNGTEKIPAMDIAKIGSNSVATLKDADGNTIGDRLLQRMPDMLANAVIEGKGYTYQRVTKLSEKMQEVKMAMNEVTPKWIRTNVLGVGDVIAPFTTIIGRFASRTLDFSPLGLAKSLYQGMKYLQGDTRYSQRLISQKFGEGLAGTASFVVLSSLVNQLGLWIPSNVKKEERERLGNIGFRPGSLNLSGFKRVAGTFFDVLRDPSMLERKGLIDTLKDAAAIQKGDTAVNTDYFPILNMHLGINKAINDSFKEIPKGASLMDTLYNIGSIALEAPVVAATELFDLPATKNISKIMNKKYDKDARWSDIFIEMAQGPVSTIIVPSVIASAARTIDGNVKDLKPLDPFNRIAARVPFLSNMVDNKLSFTGEEQSYFNKDTSWPIRALSMFVLGDLVRGQGSEDNVGLEMVKLARIADDVSDPKIKRLIAQSQYARDQFKPDKEISIGKYKATLTPEQAKEVNQSFVNDVYGELDKLLKSESYKNATAIGQISMTRSVVQRSLNKAQIYIHKRWGKDFFQRYVEKLNAERRQMVEERNRLSK